MLGNYNQTGMAASQGDFNGDCKVDINDLSIVLANYNTTAGSGTLPSPSPPPSRLLLASATCLLGYPWWRRTA